jgi:hypothetical protein
MQLAMFVTIALVCLILLIVTLVLGEIFEHGVDLAHDVVDLATGADSPTAEGPGGPSPFGLRVASAFGTGFGAAGAIATSLKQDALTSSGIAVLFGALTGLIVYEYALFLFKQEVGGVFELESLVGETAQVSVAIPSGGSGEISFVRAGERHMLTARSADGSEIPQDSEVRVEQVVGDRAIVRVCQPEEAQQ